MSFPSFASGEVLTAADMNAVGLWRLGEATMTSTTSVSLDGVFTTDYDNYLIIWQLTNSSANSDNVFLKLRKSGTPSSTGYYNQWIYSLSTGNPTTANATNEARWTIGYAGNRRASGFLNLFGPRLTQTTAFIWQGGGVSNGGTGLIASGQGVHDVADFYDGFQIETGTNMTGKFRVYGYRN
jgi:hypothetical protein